MKPKNQYDTIVTNSTYTYDFFSFLRIAIGSLFKDDILSCPFLVLEFSWIMINQENYSLSWFWRAESYVIYIKGILSCPFFALEFSWIMINQDVMVLRKTICTMIAMRELNHQSHLAADGGNSGVVAEHASKEHQDGLYAGKTNWVHQPSVVLHIWQVAIFRCWISHFRGCLRAATRAISINFWTMLVAEIISGQLFSSVPCHRIIKYKVNRWVVNRKQIASDHTCIG